MGPRLWISPGSLFLAALALLLIPLPWLGAMVCAAAFHELCHILALLLLRADLGPVRTAPWGAIIDTAYLQPHQELLGAAAGPVGSLLLLVLARWFPRLALCGIVQGLYNLLPLYPSDGGRILGAVLQILLPHCRERVLARTADAVMCLTVLAAVILACFQPGWILPIICTASIILRPCLQKNSLQRRLFGGTMDASM